MKVSLHSVRWAILPLLLAGAVPAGAIDRLVVTVAQLSTARAELSSGRLTVTLGAQGAALRARAAAIRVSRTHGPALTGIELSCARIRTGAVLDCTGGRFAARTGVLGVIRAGITARYDRLTGAMRVSARGLRLAGGRATLAGWLKRSTWGAVVKASDIHLGQAARLARPWVRLPTGAALKGPLNLQLAVTDRPALTVGFKLGSANLNFSNGPGTLVAEHLATSVHGTLTWQRGRLEADLVLHGSRGQALAGTVYSDFSAHPLALRLSAIRRATGLLELSGLKLSQRGVIDARARCTFTLGAHPRIRSAEVHLTRVDLPGALASFAQMALSSGALGSLKGTGQASGGLRIRDGRLVRVDAVLHEVGLEDPPAHLFVTGANGNLHWGSAAGLAVPISHLSWRSVGAYGLTGGPARITFLAWKHNFAVLGGNVRLPVFNGAIIVRTLVGRDLGTPRAKLDFDADLTPISMPRLSKAFGWPVMSGTLSGRIPLVQYQNNALIFHGDLVAHVFDGVITGSNIQLRQPLGPWPRLDAAVKARGLDLGMVTRTFAFGSMTGRIDADISGLKLFDWSPVAFDARIYTMPGDRSPQRISQNAVTRIAAFGGGAGAVTAALESGVLRFFKTFHYRRIAIGCRLRNEVCLMSGAGPAPGGGYYLVQGSWIPQLNIIGNVRRVDWPRMLRQIEQGIHGGGVKVN